MCKLLQLQNRNQFYIKVYVFEYNVIKVPVCEMGRCSNTFVHIVYLGVTLNCIRFLEFIINVLIGVNLG